MLPELPSSSATWIFPSPAPAVAVAAPKGLGSRAQR